MSSESTRESFRHLRGRNAGFSLDESTFMREGTQGASWARTGPGSRSQGEIEISSALTLLAVGVA